MAYCHHAIIFLELVDIFTCTEIMDYRMHWRRQLALFIIVSTTFQTLNFNKIKYTVFYISDIKLSVVVLS